MKTSIRSNRVMRHLRRAPWALAVLLATHANAEMREYHSCPVNANSLKKHCYANDPRERDSCLVGLRGDFLDLTDRVEILSSHRASISIMKKGAGDALQGDCVPFKQGQREGFVQIGIQNVQGSSASDLRLRLHRIAGHDDVRIPLRSASNWLRGDQTSAASSAVVGETKVFELKGAGLQNLRLRAAVQPGRNEILSQSPLEARVRMTFERAGDVRLDSVFRFEGGESERQNDEGWPVVRVREARAAGAPPAAAPATVAPPPPPPRSAGETRPNLLPVRLFAERPLIHKLNTETAVMVSPGLCVGLRSNDSRDVDVPAFEWGVSNTNAAAVNQPFTVTLTDGASGRVLDTMNVPALRAGENRTVRNWPGRPARISVVLVGGPPLLDQYPRQGCFIQNGKAVPLDPRPLVIRVDTASGVTESVETDNELRTN